MDVGEEVIPGGRVLVAHHAGGLIDRLIVESTVGADRVGEVLRRGLDILRRRHVIVVDRRIVRGLGNVEETALIRRAAGAFDIGADIGADVRTDIGVDIALDVLVLDRLTQELVDGLQHAGVVPRAVVVFVVDRR